MRRSRGKVTYGVSQRVCTLGCSTQAAWVVGSKIVYLELFILPFQVPQKCAEDEAEPMLLKVVSSRCVAKLLEAREDDGLQGIPRDHHIDKTRT